MDKFAENFKRILSLRKSDDKGVRTKWWASLYVLIGLILFHSGWQTYLLVLWSCYNVIIGLVSFAWMLLHPRSMGKSSDTALVWSRWLTVAAAIAIYINSQPSSVNSTATPGLVLLLVLAAFFAEASFSFSLSSERKPVAIALI